MKVLQELSKNPSWECVEKLAAQIDWNRVPKTQPPQEWFDDTDNPFAPEEERD